MLQNSVTMVALVEGSWLRESLISISTRQSCYKIQARHVIALSKLSLSPRDILQRVVNVTEVWYRRSDGHHAREPGENCIDNMTIAWMATVNLSLYMIRWHRERPALTAKCRANGKSRALSRWIRMISLFLVHYYKTFTFLRLSWYRESYDSDKLRQIYVLC